MATPLLVTKLFRPVPRADLVHRNRLIARLDEVFAPGCRMALVCAPAGFGKTTLVSDWAADCRWPVAWLSLDEGDDDREPFWFYVATALDGLVGGEGAIAARFEGPHPPSTRPLLVDLMNRLSEADSPAALVLDDYHLISSPAIHGDMVYLAEHLPPAIRLVLLTRSNPPWPLARLRGRGQMVELRTADLRFTPDEVGSYLNDNMGLALSEESVAALERRTEGWVASLHLAALSLRGHEDTQAFVDSFSASHRFVLDYLIEEVLDRQPADIRAFLLQTSVLDRMCGSLCDAATGRSDSQSVLEHLESANLFLVPLDDARRWYRYHPLFAEMLRQRLQRERPDELSCLHHRVSVWYESLGLVPEALHHALVAGSVEQAARVVEGNVTAMLDHGELKTLDEWLDRLPVTVTRTRPWLCLARAWLLAFTGEPDKATEFLACAEAIQSDYESGGQRDEARHIAGHIVAIRAYQTAFQRDFRKVADLAAEALGLLPATDATTRCFAALLLSSMLRRMGELSSAAEPLEQVLSSRALPPDSHTAILARDNLGILRGVQGRLREAAAIFRGVLADQASASIRSGDRPPAATLGLAYLGLAETLRERNDTTEAVRLAREGVGRAERWGSVDMLSGAFFTLGRVLQASHDEGGMRRALEDALRVAETSLPGMLPVVQAECAEVLLSHGDVDSAITWAEGCGLHADDDFPFQDRRTYITLARVLAVQARWSQAQLLLSRLLEAVDRVGAVTDLIQVLAILALVHNAQGNQTQAQAGLARALALAEPEGFVRVFIDLGPPMVDLLRDARAAGVAPTYLDVLLEAARRPSGVRVVPPPPVTSHEPDPQTALIEPLSDRELEILQFLRSSLTNREIADQLYVSVNTVRTHVRHVYEKLGVHRRLDAIDRAEDLGLF